MIANILQLTAGVLLAISSFVVKEFNIPIFGQKLTSVESFKQMWLVRFGLILLVAGYALPIINWDLKLPDYFSMFLRFFIGFGLTGILIFVFYKISVVLAKKNYKESPVFDKSTPVPKGTIAIELEDESEPNRNK